MRDFQILISQKYVDRELFLYVASIDENLSWHVQHNAAVYGNDDVDVTDEDVIESNVMRCTSTKNTPLSKTHTLYSEH